METYYIVSGGFDPIHEGHIEMIKSSAAASDGVIVLANSDDWLCRKKGKNFHSMKTRKAILENLKGVIDVLQTIPHLTVSERLVPNIRAHIWFLPTAETEAKIIFRKVRYVRNVMWIWYLVSVAIIKPILLLGFWKSGIVSNA